MKIFFTVLILFIYGSLFCQKIVGKLVLHERNGEPVKEATVFFLTSKDSIIGKTISNNRGIFEIFIDTIKYRIIKIHQPLFGVALIYDKKYDKEYENKIVSNDTLIFRLAFDYAITKRGEAIYYKDINQYLSEKNAKCLDLKNQNLESIPKLKALKKHGVLGLFLEDNRLTNIPNKLFKIKRLNYVDLSGNKLNKKSIDLIEKWKKKGIMIIY
jgi:hypothetical protein